MGASPTRRALVLDDDERLGRRPSAERLSRVVSTFETVTELTAAAGDLLAGVEVAVGAPRADPA